MNIEYMQIHRNQKHQENTLQKPSLAVKTKTGSQVRLQSCPVFKEILKDHYPGWVGSEKIVPELGEHKIHQYTNTGYSAK